MYILILSVIVSFTITFFIQETVRNKNNDKKGFKKYFDMFKLPTLVSCLVVILFNLNLNELSNKTEQKIHRGIPNF
jgi:uncharacterized membrane protein YiaA